MKQFISLGMLLVVLASCGTETVIVDDVAEVPTEIVQETTSQIDAEIVNFDAGTPPEEEIQEQGDNTSTVSTLEEEDAKVVKVQAVYNNPKQEVVVDIEYSLDNEGKISSIDITDSNYDLTKNLGDINVLVGKSLDEVDDTYIAGGSLTIPAIKSALSQQG